VDVGGVNKAEGHEPSYYAEGREGKSAANPNPVFGQ